jgi:hypothetical protein
MNDPYEYDARYWKTADEEFLNPDFDVSLLKARCMLGYDPTTGEFVWRHRSARWFDGIEARAARWNAKYAGKPAGYLVGNGYRMIPIFSRSRPTPAGRLALYITHGDMPEGSIRHRNGNTDDNRLENLQAIQPKRKRKTRRAKELDAAVAEFV